MLNTSTLHFASRMDKNTYIDNTQKRLHLKAIERAEKYLKRPKGFYKILFRKG